MLLDDVLLITGGSHSGKGSGTGFVIHRDAASAYVLTCDHVVEDLVESGEIRVNGRAAHIEARGTGEGIDLAVLRVVGLPAHYSVLRLHALGQRGKQVHLAGFRRAGEEHLVRSMGGTLGEQVGVQRAGALARVRGWDLKIEGDQRLERGYSGSPVMDEATNAVLGVVSHRVGSGDSGICISVEAVSTIWPPARVGAGPGESEILGTQPNRAGSTGTFARALAMARRALDILEERAAGYTTLTMPVHLQIELEEKRREVEQLQQRQDEQ